MKVQFKCSNCLSITCSEGLYMTRPSVYSYYKLPASDELILKADHLWDHTAGKNRHTVK
jgi:hypothetical protein